MNLLQALGLEGAPERLLLVDGHAALYRSFHAIPELTAPDGRPVNAVYGLVRTLLMALRAYPSRYLAIVFDAEGDTIRHEAYAEYKATRKDMPESLVPQVELAKEVADVLGVPRFELVRYEADDVLATLARSAEREGVPVLLLTGDKDMAQLVTDRVHLLRPGRRPSDPMDELDPDGVRARYGVRPELMADLLALVGDSSDNVPGVKGIGDKGARELLNQYGSLDAALDAAEKHPNPRLGRALAAGREAAELSRSLVRLHEVPLETELADLRPRSLDEGAVRARLGELDFRSVLADLKLDAPGPQSDHTCVTDEVAFERLLGELRGADAVAVDLETTSADPLSAEIVGVAVAWETGEGYYVPVAHAYAGAPEQIPLERVLEGLRPILEGERPEVLGQNLKYDMQVLGRYGIALRGIRLDTMLAHWLLHPDATSHSLEAIARDTLGVRVQSYRELVAGGQVTMAEVPLEQASPYAASDAEVVVRLRDPLEFALREAELHDLLISLEIPLIEVLARMEERGILLDVDVLRDQGVELETQLERLRASLFDLAGGPFNPGSIPQVRDVLYGRLGLPVLARTKTGPSTDAQVLRDLATHHDFPAVLIAYRELEKLRNTYVEKLPKYVHPRTGRVHTSFHQTGTATGRLSSSEPNLQNIPSRHEVGVDIRRAFIAPEGRVFLMADYSQIELRVLAHLSEDEALIGAFRQGEDLHRATASRLFGVAPERVDARMRSLAKRVNFGIVYGISPFGLARDLGIEQGEARELIARFFQAYPEVRAYMDRLIADARAKGYARTLLGRRRPLGAGRSRGRGAEERNAINTPIQGTAADIMKLAMRAVHRLWTEGELRAELILQVHDALLFEVDEDEVAYTSEVVVRAMEGVWPLHVPLRVDTKAGPNWGAV